MRPTEKSARLAEPGLEFAQSQSEILPGAFHALLQQIGSPGLSAEWNDPFWNVVGSAPGDLGRFLEGYLVRLLLPCELPAIVTACGHARHGELRELLAHDQSLAERMQATPFAAPSRRMGWLQLTRLRPLRDDRVVQRYLAAVESRQAYGWHTIVFGVSLAVYSLPLRQGLMFYAQETLSAMAAAAGRSKSLDESELAGLLSNLLSRVPKAIEANLATQEGFGGAAHRQNPSHK